MRLFYLPPLFMCMALYECVRAFEHLSEPTAATIVLFGTLAIFANVNCTIYVCKQDLFMVKLWSAVFCSWSVFYLFVCAVSENPYVIPTTMWSFSATTTQISALLWYGGI